MTRLVIDSREHSDLTEHVVKKASEYNIKMQKEWLEVGDYVFGDVCFEAKSSFDFLQSVTNKRLWNQLDNMDRNYPNNLVIVYGSFDAAFRQNVKHNKSNINRRTLRVMLKKKFYGAMGKIILDTDCSLLWFKDAQTAAEMICVVCKMQPHDRPIHTPRIIKQKTITTTDLRVDVLMTIKGISEKKAKILLDEFGSLMESGEALPSEIEMLDGFGNVLANRIIDTLNSEDKIVI